MISKAKLKLIKSLKYKKTRDELNLFLVEGIKGILEVSQSKYDVILTVVSKKIFKEYKNSINKNNVNVLEEDDIKNFSLLKNNRDGFCVVKKVSNSLSFKKLGNVSIALDSLNDPGNLGTIIRNADWFGIQNIICSKNCVDLYNPKVIQSSMGSFTRVNVFYQDLEIVFSNDCKVIGTTSDQNKLGTTKNFKKGIILFGNESRGISKELEPYVDSWISIKKLGVAESLNVSVSTGIILDNLLNS